MYYRKVIQTPEAPPARFKTLCQTARRGDELMSADIARHDPFQTASRHGSA